MFGKTRCLRDNFNVVLEGRNMTVICELKKFEAHEHLRCGQRKQSIAWGHHESVAISSSIQSRLQCELKR